MPTYDVKIRRRSESPENGTAEAPAPAEEAPAPKSVPGEGAESLRIEAGLPASLQTKAGELPLGSDEMHDVMSAKIALHSAPGSTIEIRSPEGHVQEHRLPSEPDLDELDDGESGDFGTGAMRRDSLGMRVSPQDSWSPLARDRRKNVGSIRDFARSVATWIILLALSIDALALIVEPIYLLKAGAPFRAAVATALAAIGLSIFFSIAAAIPMALVHALVRLIGRQRRPFNYVWPLPLLIFGWELVGEVAQHRVIHSLSLFQGQLILAGLFCAALVVAVGITRIRAARVRAALGMGIAAAAFIANAFMPAVLTREPRDLLWISAVLCFASVFYPLRRGATTMAHDRVARFLGFLTVGSVAMLLLAPVVCSDWRTWASNGGRFAPRLARFCRMMVDLDGDGVSAVAWGTDCDDFDSLRYPSLPEWDDGKDHNCNGKVRPTTSTPEMRGLAPAVGNPDAAPQEFDRAILVTVDCFRDDALRPEVTPNLVKLAARGLRFQKLYSGGARTALSLPLLLRGGYKSPSVTRMLGAAHVSTVALFGYRHSTLEGNVFDDFQIAKRPDLVDHRIRAPELTDMALADLRDPKNATQHFLWVHYFDAHGPRTLRVLPNDLPDFPMPKDEVDPEMTLYLKQLYFIDRHLGRLIEGIDALPGRTLLILTNDHGEGFGQHGVYEHGISSFEQIIHAPGILVAPGIAPGVYPHVLAQRDIAATIAGAFGLVASHPEIENFGRSWLRLRDAPFAPLHDFAISYETTSPFEHWSDAPMASIVDDEGKFSISYVDGIHRYYRMNEDPAELHDLTAERPADVARYLDRLETYRDIDTTPH